MLCVSKFAEEYFQTFHFFLFVHKQDTHKNNLNILEYYQIKVYMYLILILLINASFISSEISFFDSIYISLLRIEFISLLIFYTLRKAFILILSYQITFTIVSTTQLLFV